MTWIVLRGAAVGLAVAALGAAAPAQLVGPGLTWLGSSGASAGGFVPGCSTSAVAAARGEAVTVTVWGDFDTPYALLAAARTGVCTPVPGIGGGLLLDPPLLVPAIGVLRLVSPCLSCPQAFAETRFGIPAGVPAGAMLSLQALAFGGRSPALTGAITATVE